MPVKLGIKPDRAFLYKPFGSLFSASSRETSTWISINSFLSITSLAKFLSDLKGEINETKVISLTVSNFFNF